jgi:hypothetical protein
MEDSGTVSGVAPYLSDEWIAEMDEAGRRCATEAPASVATVAHVVTGGPEGTIRYHLLLDGTGIRVRRGPGDRPDATFESDWDTATGLAQGERHAQLELTAGRLRARGDTAVLAEWTAALAALDLEAEAVRARTTYPSAPGA